MPQVHGGVGHHGVRHGCSLNGPRNGVRDLLQQKSWSQSYWLARQGKRVLVWCDNLAVVQIIRGLASRDPLLMHLLRLLYFFMAAHSIQLTANHIPGVHNTIADSLSRNFMQVFRQLPAAHPTATEVPDELQHLLVTDHEIWLSPESLKASLLTV